ncbi:MAG TPA: ATP-binding protein [Candidatus Cloacimonadota bacterium]|nr:ATP-binding protein [Candidatus Cloacimonadota bacterium]HPK39988.1 ATP-binding protein [Candidatus Cloacimonadota bacterium]
MYPKITFVNTDLKANHKKLDQNMDQLTVSDFVSEVNNCAKDDTVYIFENLNHFLNINIDRIIAFNTIFFYFNSYQDVIDGLSRSTNKDISAICDKIKTEHLLKDVVHMSTLIKQEFCHNQCKSVFCHVESCHEDIDNVSDLLGKFINNHYRDITKLEFFEFNLVLRELLTNAVKHGNKLDKTKDIIFAVFLNIDEGRIGFAVKDEGEGFDFKGHLHSIEKDELRINERGLFLINEFCNKIYSNNNLIIVELKK